MFFIFYNCGELSLSDVNKECKQDHWVPVCCYYKDGKTYVPAFGDIKTAKAFARRNQPKGHMWGTMTLPTKDREFIKNSGWIIKNYDFPRKIKDLVEFDCKIIEFDDDVMVVAR